MSTNLDFLGLCAGLAVIVTAPIWASLALAAILALYVLGVVLVVIALAFALAFEVLMLPRRMIRGVSRLLERRCV